MALSEKQIKRIANSLKHRNVGDDSDFSDMINGGVILVDEVSNLEDLTDDEDPQASKGRVHVAIATDTTEPIPFAYLVFSDIPYPEMDLMAIEQLEQWLDWEGIDTSISGVTTFNLEAYDFDMAVLNVGPENKDKFKDVDIPNDPDYYDV